MTRSVSTYLDILRFSSAVMVAYGHLTQKFFSSNTRDLTYLSTAAVAVFFVLSGFVIRYVAEEKEAGFQSFSIARLARIYSVLVPALILTMGVYIIVGLSNPGFYGSWAIYSDHPLFRMGTCLLFLNEVYAVNVVPFSNSPVWSLGYEVPYYFMFGIFFFLRGNLRIWLLCGMALLCGPSMFVLFPTWLVGAWLYGRLKGRSVSRLTGMLCLVAAALTTVGYAKLIYPNTDAIRLFLKPVWFLGDRYSEHFPLFYAVAIVVSLSIVVVRAFDAEVGIALAPVTKMVRAAASATFSIYLYHFPLLVLAYGLTSYDRSSAPIRAVVFVAVLGACFALSTVTEARKAVWALWITRAVQAPRRLAAHQPVR